MDTKTHTVWLTVNRTCNLRCAWCYAKGTGFAQENMSLATVRTTLDMLATVPASLVHLIGGEPTVHPDFFTIVSMVRDAGLRPSLITNGMAFHKTDFLVRAVDAGLIGAMTSLKGANGEQYRRNTGTNAFEKVMAGIRNVEELRRSVPFSHRVSLTMCRQLFETIDEMLDTMRKCGATEFTIDTERPVFIGGRAQPVKDAAPKEMADLLVAAYPKIKASGLRCLIRISLPFCLFPDTFINELRRDGALMSGCQLIGGSGIIIDPHGKFLPCNHFCDRPIGEMTEGFTGDDYRDFRARADVLRFYRAMAHCPHRQCQQCEQWEACGGGCRVHWFASRAEDLLKEVR